MAVCRFNEDLIEMVRNNPPLYNWRLPSCKDDDYKQNTWKDISEKLGESVEVCRRRWRSLRTRYRRELLKLERGDPSINYKRKWVYFDSLNFLYDHLRARDTAINYALEQTSSDDGQDGPCSLVTQTSNKRKRPTEERIHELGLDESPSVDGYVTVSLDTKDFSERQNDNFSSFQANQSRALEMDPSTSHSADCGPSDLWSIMDLSQSILKGVQSKINEIKSVDCDEAEQFGRLVASKLRKLKSVSNAEIKILNVLYEEELAEKGKTDEQ